MTADKGYSPRLEQLEARHLMAVVVAESEPNNSKQQADLVAVTPAAPVVEVAGRIRSIKDEDFFRLSSPATGTVQLAVANGTGLLGRVSIEDGSGRKLLETDARNRINSGSFTIQAGQDAFLRVRGHSHGPVGNYTLELRLNVTPTNGGGGSPGGGTPPAPPNTTLVEKEFNNTRATANIANLDSTGSLRIKGTAVSDRDQDFFLLRPTQSGRLSIQLASTGSAAKLEVQDAFGRELLEIEQNDGVHAGSVQLQAGHTYFIRLRSAGKAPSAYLVDLALAAGV